MNRDRYHDLLNSEAATEIKQIFRSDIEPAEVVTAQDLDRYILATGLPTSMSSDSDSPIPDLPFTAPFSRGLPGVRPVPPQSPASLIVSLYHC